MLTNAVNTDLGFVILDRELVRKSIENPLDRVGFLQRNRDNQARLTRQLREQLTQALILGEAYGKAAKRIKERMNVGATNAMRIAQTENHRTRIQGQLERMKDGIERGIVLQKMWLATVDSKTRDAHGRLDGVQIDLDQQFEIDGYTAEAPGIIWSTAFRYTTAGVSSRNRRWIQTKTTSSSWRGCHRIQDLQ